MYGIFISTNKYITTFIKPSLDTEAKRRKGKCIWLITVRCSALIILPVLHVRKLSLTELKDNTEILERHWRHTLQAKPLRRGKTLTPPKLQPVQSISTSR
jgi:hypothetical protein